MAVYKYKQHGKSVYEFGHFVQQLDTYKINVVNYTHMISVSIYTLNNMYYAESGTGINDIYINENKVITFFVCLPTTIVIY